VILMIKPPLFDLDSINQRINNGNNNQLAGRDINNFYPQHDAKMKALMEEYKQEQINNIEFNQVIKELDYYLNPLNSEVQNIVGLEKKLKDGQFDEYLEYAMTVKDTFYRKVEQYRLSKAAQNIFLYIMADVLTIFHQKIYPLICNNTSHDIIMNKIDDEIIKVLSQKLGENVLNIFSDSITGIIYYLTGNCHIKWSKE